MALEQGSELLGKVRELIEERRQETLKNSDRIWPDSLLPAIFDGDVRNGLEYGSL
jgi:hypothetical protein